MKRPGFTLMELMLVVVIIGVVYGLVISGMQRYSEKRFDMELMNLPDFLSEKYQGRAVSFICTDGCQECAVYEEGSMIAEVENFLDAPVEAYRFDHRYGTSRISWAPLFDEDGRDAEVCFRYDTDKHGNGTKMAVKYQGQVVSYGGYFGSAERYASLDAAVEAYEARRQKAAR